MPSKKSDRRKMNPISLAFLDVMFCGFGAVILILLLGSCGLKGPIYLPKDPSRCLGCSVDNWFKAVKKVEEVQVEADD